MDLKLNIDYKIPEKEKKDDAPTPQEMTEDYINYTVNTVFKDGLEGQKRRIWARIKTKISEGVEKDANDVIIEAAEVDFLKDTFAKAKCPPGIAQYYVILEDEINKL